MKRKNYWFLFAILLLSLTSLSQGQDLTGNNGGNEERKTPPLYPQPSSLQNTDDHPIRVTVHLDEEDYKELVKINDTYTHETGTVIELSNIPDSDAYQQLVSAMDVGEGPDVLLVNSSWIGTMAAGGYLLPVESYQSSTSGGEIISSLQQEVEWNGYQWGTPFDMDPYVLVWQLQTLHTLSIQDIPGGIKDWKELLVKQESRNDKKLLAMNSSDGFAFAALAGSMGTNPMNPGKEEMEWLSKARPFMGFIDSANTEASNVKISKQEPVLLLTPVSDTEGYKSADFELRMPEKLYIDYPFLLRSHSYAVSAESQQPEEAAKWIAYMSTNEVQQMWHHATGRLPALKGNYEAAVFNPAELPFRLHLLLQTAANPLQQGSMQTKWDMFSKAADRFLTGQITDQEFKAEVEETGKNKP